MKKIGIITGILFLILISVILYLKFFWGIRHVDYNSDIFSVFPPKNNELIIELGNYDSGVVFDKYQYRIENNKIIFWLISKVRTSGSQVGIKKISIPLQKENIYQLYYINSDDSEIFMKQVENKG